MATFTAGGVTQRYSTILSVKDVVLAHITGDADSNSGDSYTDAALHYCFFEFDSATLPDGDIQIESSAGACSGIVNCGYCEATQLDYPNCEIACTINTTAHSGLVGEYLEIRYVDKLIMYTDAAGSSGGALRVEGEKRDSINFNNLFDSTTREFTIVDGGMVLDQVTPLTDYSSVDQFDYALEITNTILDPNASAHNPALPDDTAWVDIESRVTAQLSLTDLAVPSTSIDLDAGHYLSNAGFWHDAAREENILFLLDMYDPYGIGGNDLTFDEAGVSHVCDDTEGDDCNPAVGAGNSGCLPYLINGATAPDDCINLCFDYTGIGPPTTGGSTMADYIVSGGLTDQPTCEANGGSWEEVDPGVFLCLPTQMMACVPPEPEPQYSREDAYLADLTVPYDEDEPAEAAMATIFSHGSDAQNYGAADFIWNVDKTMYQYMIDCANASKGYALAAVPYERNTSGMNSDSSIDDTCINVAQRFVSTTINPGDPGTDKALTPYNLSVVYENFGSTTTQGMVIRILDGVASAGGEDSPVFEDISGTYITGDDTAIPAARRVTHDAATQWFDVPDNRVSLQINPLLDPGAGEGNWMSVYTDDGLTKGGESWIKVSTYLDFYRINEANLFEPTPENVYLMYIDLMAPIAADGSNAGMGCNFWQQFVIDGTCACDLDPDACP